MDQHDVVILGGGSGGEATARAAVEAGRGVTLVEEWLVGGECPFTACMPSKAVLHVAATGGTWAEAVQHRDEVAEHRDDSGHVTDLEEAGVTVLRGRGRVTGPGRLHVALRDGQERTLAWRALVLATGAAAVVPPIDGLDTVEHWTSDDLWTTAERPASIVIVGGGAVGIEAAQALASFGTDVVLVERAPRLVPDVPELDELVRSGLARAGVVVHTDTAVAGVVATDGGVCVTTGDGDEHTAERLLLAAGKRPRRHDIGLSSLGVDPDGLEVGRDGRVEGVEGLWAVGDVTGLPAFTHTANLLAAAVGRNLGDGGSRAVEVGHTPRAVFTDPPHVLVGDLAPDTAHVRVTATYDEIARPITDRTGPGRFVLTAARDDRRVLGVAGVGAVADELASAWTLLVAAGLDVDLVARTQQQFPTHGEITRLLGERAVAALDG